METARKTERRVQFLNNILSEMESHDIFQDCVNRGNDSESSIQKALFSRLQGKLPSLIQEAYGYSPGKAEDVVNKYFVWESKSSVSVNNFPFFSTNHRPDAALNVEDIAIGVEIKKGEDGLSVRSGIGQSVVYATQFDFVIYFFVDETGGRDIRSSSSAEKESELVSSLWDDFNIAFRVV